jgi:protein phosphatase
MDLIRRLFGSAKAPDKKPETPSQTLSPDTIPTSPFSTQELTSAPQSTPVYPTSGENATRQISLDKPIITDAHPQFGQRSDIGTKRGNNEDAVFTFLSNTQSDDNLPDFGLFIVADGMGGHQAGEKASSMAVRIIAGEVLKAVYTPLLTTHDRAHIAPISEVLNDALTTANTEIHTTIPGNAGSTGTTLVLFGNQAYIGHVGDSRCYLIADNKIELLTRDHSFAQRLVEVGHLTQEEVRTHPKRGELYRALGIKESVEVEVITRQIPQKARFLICSDGLWEVIDDLAIQDIVLRSDNLQEAAYDLVESAKALGSDDNITALVLQVN